ncbi:nucleotidyltransferase family protein [Hanstruepera ponticola]|uniref:nucleotidyltransferase family protein n=1 Tax=Hanstruepera ponticola TaxID=2042995 RepID=UPI0017848455|nr:nucleotidyltransferase family protein [Hanstruepera ponticola]
MASLHETYKYIADIISFKSDLAQLQDNITSKRIDWSDIVKVASDHLVLTTVYCRLKDKSLLQYLPEDLKDYLTELTAINRNRNDVLVEDITEISKLFSTNHINHVFLKGAAIIISGYYEDSGERMIGDIDILVERSQVNLAKKLLITMDYLPGDILLSEKYQDKRHIPRLVNETKLAPIEIHTELLMKKHLNKLSSKDVLIKKQYVNGVFVPHASHLLNHCILSFQINDNGNYFNSIHLKNIYDSLVITKKHQSLAIQLHDNAYQKFFLFSSIYFQDIQKPNQTLKNKILSRCFVLNTKNNTIGLLKTQFLKNILNMKVLINRFLLFLKNKNYRADLIQSLKQ